MATDDSDDTFSRLFRREAIVSDVDLRIDVAETIVHSAAGEEEVTLEERDTHVRGAYVLSRGARDRTVGGDYTRDVAGGETFTVGSVVEEHVAGGAHVTMQVESEAILAGAYVNTVAGVAVRMAAYVDFLAWGGWAEVDVTRTHVAGVSIVSYMACAHAAGARTVLASSLVDDFVLRTETFGVLTDTRVQTNHVGCPGSGETLET